jgi:uncharacterized protein (UPF0548 family)
VFRLKKPTAAEIERLISAASRLHGDFKGVLQWPSGVAAGRLEPGMAHDFSRTRLGNGEAAFSAAKQAFERWAMFDLGWVRVANADAVICPGQVVAVEAHTLGLWTLNLSRIVKSEDSATVFGFLYATTRLHVEQGEERFLLEFDRETGDVWYGVEAVSRPRATLARLGFPMTRALQQRFARESHERMLEEVSAAGVRALK